MNFSLIESFEFFKINEGISYSWSGYLEESNNFSLLKYIEDNGDYFKNKYSNWVYEAGEYEFKGRSVTEHFLLKDKLSYWWLMPITEKSFWKSSYIIDILRLMALEELVSKNQISTFHLYINDSSLNEVLSNFCKTKNIKYHWHKSTKIKPIKSFNTLYRILLPILASLSLIKYLIQRWPLSKVEKPTWFNDHKSIFFCSYFFNLDSTSLKDGDYRSLYWGDLHKLILELGLKSNWLQLYIKHKVVSTSKDAKKILNLFNKDNNNKHHFLDSYLTFRIILNVVVTFLNLIYKSYYISSTMKAFKSKESEMIFWPLIRQEWYNSLRGPTAISNLLNYFLFNEALSKLPPQRIGFYIFENQVWERAFVHNWYKYGHGKLIGVAHSTVRYWDLRYTSDIRLTNKLCSNTKMPYPDFIALNGEEAIHIYLKSKYPFKSILKCEAVRYLSISQNSLKLTSHTEIKSSKISVLILGDYLSNFTIKIIKLIQDSIPFLPPNFTFTLKPHPADLLSNEYYKTINFEITTKPLEKILNNFNIIFSSNYTSASVDAYIFRKRVIVFLDNFQLNLSPLRNSENVFFVCNFEQLVDALTNKELQIENEKMTNFFFLDSKLERWRKILTLQF